MKTTTGNTNYALGREKELADKWRFARWACGYQMRITAKASPSYGFWSEILQHGGGMKKAELSLWHPLREDCRLVLPSE
jgi:hypothetical protein